MNPDSQGNGGRRWSQTREAVWKQNEVRLGASNPIRLRLHRSQHSEERPTSREARDSATRSGRQPDSET
jgi:hypothetical protein